MPAKSTDATCPLCANPGTRHNRYGAVVRAIQLGVFTREERHASRRALDENPCEETMRAFVAVFAKIIVVGLEAPDGEGRLTTSQVRNTLQLMLRCLSSLCTCESGKDFEEEWP